MISWVVSLSMVVFNSMLVLGRMALIFFPPCLLSSSELSPDESRVRRVAPLAVVAVLEEEVDGVCVDVRGITG